MEPKALEQRWQVIEHLDLTCPACGSKGWQRSGNLVGFDPARKPESARLEGLVSPTFLVRVCSACGYVALFLRDF